MAARALLTPKTSSVLFEDRCVCLDQPSRVGRSHKDDRSDSSNGIFECKVLSRNHALLLFQEGKFFIVDTGSSNGTFVNNIRLSKCGEESQPTQLFTGDSLRFGSDVVDKAKNITQKCVVARIQLFHPDGSEYETRPQTSRLFRPTSGEDFNGGGASSELELVLGEKEELLRKLSNIELQLAEREMFFSSVGAKQERDAEEITKLRLLVDSQNSDIANLEGALGDTQSQLERIQSSAGEENERRMLDLMSKYEDQIKLLEDSRQAEESRLKQQLEEVTGNEVHLLDRIKSLESESEYAQAGVEKIVVKESNEFEYKQVKYKHCTAFPGLNWPMLTRNASSVNVKLTSLLCRSWSTTLSAFQQSCLTAELSWRRLRPARLWRDQRTTSNCWRRKINKS